MTLVLAVNGPETIWLLADRRVSYSNRPPMDDARKVMFLEPTDGIAILGYAGLGATALGTEPADWMSTVLRGRNLPLEQSLGVLARAMDEQLPRHLVGLPVGTTPVHQVIVPAFVGEEPRFYLIELVLAPDRNRHHFHCRRIVANEPPTVPPRPPRTAVGGSGGRYVVRDENWLRSLLHMVNAHDRGRVSARAVADYLAALNNKAHLDATSAGDESVGHRCIVAWRYRKDGVHKGGGAQQSYTGLMRDTSSPSLPLIANGTDLSALIEAMAPYMNEQLVDLLDGKPTQELDKDEINAALARLPDKPDEKLR